MRRVLPLIPRDLESVTTTEFQAGKTAMQKNKLEDGVQAFRKVLHLLILNAVSTQKSVTEVSKLEVL
jgi:coatomer protein complex subunit alpha (xenin)